MNMTSRKTLHRDLARKGAINVAYEGDDIVTFVIDGSDVLLQASCRDINGHGFKGLTSHVILHPKITSYSTFPQPTDSVFPTKALAIDHAVRTLTDRAHEIRKLGHQLDQADFKLNASLR